jgi:hypothetical protein
LLAPEEDDMSKLWGTFSELVSHACGGGADSPPARRAQLGVLAALLALGLAALWGLAAGSRAGALALGNLFKVPLVVLLSALCALPAALLTLRLAGGPYRGAELVFRHAAALLGAALVLVVLAPLIAIYGHTSAWAGPWLTLGSIAGAIGVATLVLARGALRLGGGRLVALAPVAVLITLQICALLQFVALAAPFVAGGTPFDHGIDGMVPR